MATYYDDGSYGYEYSSGTDESDLSMAGILRGLVGLIALYIVCGIIYAVATYARADANKDGTVDTDEIDDALKKSSLSKLFAPFGNILKSIVKAAQESSSDDDESSGDDTQLPK